MAVVVAFTAEAAEAVSTAAVAVVRTVAAALVPAAGIAVVAAHIVAVAATVGLALMLVVAHTETAADIRRELIAAARRTVAATAPAHRWRRVPQAPTQAAGIRLVTVRIVPPAAQPAAFRAKATRSPRPERARPLTRSRRLTVWQTARACWQPTTVTLAWEPHSAPTIAATVTDAVTVLAQASATRTDMAGVVAGDLALAGVLDLASDGVGAGDGEVLTGGQRTTGATRIGDGDARAATTIIRPTMVLLRRVHTRLTDTPATMAMAEIIPRPT